MTEIYAMSQEHQYWKDTLSFAAKCSWKAGHYLSQKMANNEFHEWERVFIGFVFVGEQYRGKRLSQLLIDNTASYARELGYQKIYIMSGEIGLYEKYGFRKLGDYETIYGTVEQLFVKTV